MRDEIIMIEVSAEHTLAATGDLDFPARFSAISKIPLHLSASASRMLPPFPPFYVSRLPLVRVLSREIDNDDGGGGAGRDSRRVTPEILRFNCAPDISGRKALMDRIRGRAAPRVLQRVLTDNRADV